MGMVGLFALCWQKQTREHPSYVCGFTEITFTFENLHADCLDEASSKLASSLAHMYRLQEEGGKHSL